MKEYLLFDLDGTLMDPKLGITTCVQHALQSFGIEEPDLDKLEPFIGPPLKDSFMQFYGFDEKQAEAAVDKYRERFQDIGLFENEIYSGIREMLRTLQKKGMHLAVASSKPTVFVERILEHFKIRKYFEVVVGSELDGRRVNKDEVVQEALSRLFSGGFVDRAKVYMIGDRKFDIEGARAQEVESVGVSYGYGSIEELKEAGADYIVRTVGELENLLYREVTDREGESFFRSMIPLFGPVMLLILLKRLGHVWYGMTGLLFHGNINLLVIGVAFLLAGVMLKRTARWYLGRGEDIRYLQHLRPESNTQLLHLLLGSLGIFFGMVALLHQTGLAHRSMIYHDMIYARGVLMRSFYAEQYAVSLPIGMLCTVVILPVVESYVFRGVLQNGLREKMKPMPAILGSALLFAMYQTQPGMALYGLVLGLLLGYTYEYFGSFRLTVILHIMSAFFMYLLTCRTGSSPLFSWPACIICLVVGAFFMVMLAVKKKVR
ncbi:MAG: HAD hydrolase-like protein [Lachnospiraceae bacterium]|nr:HAD hydrolase-like protein [Lachnospiraceae bacterium]